MLKRSIKFIVVCLAACCAFLLGTQWEEQKMEELLAIIEKLEIRAVGCNQEKEEMSSKVEMLLGEANEKETFAKKCEEQMKELREEVKRLRDIRRNIGDEMTADRIIVQTNNAYYKMFYGKWRISSVIEGQYFEEYNNYYDEEKANRYLGRMVEYSCGSIKVDGERVLMAPAYAYAIVPINQLDRYVENYSPRENIIDSTKNNYFIYVVVGSEWNKSDYQEQDIFKSFFIVDDDKMVLAADGVYFWMERVEHEWDYEFEEKFQDYAW